MTLVFFFQLYITRCMLSQQSLPSLQKLSRLRDLRISTRVLDEVGCSVSSNIPTPEEPPTVLSHVEAVTVEHDNIVQVRREISFLNFHVKLDFDLWPTLQSMMHTKLIQQMFFPCYDNTLILNNKGQQL